MLQLGEKCTMACETNKPIVSGSSQNHLIKIPSEISSLRGEYCIIFVYIYNMQKYYRLLLFGGPDGELAASMRYLSQRYTMPYKEVTATLTDIGTEELAHMEMICAIVHQLTKNLSPEEIERSGFAPYYVDHTLALWPQAASGAPWTATYFQSKGDPITDLHEDLAADGATA